MTNRTPEKTELSKAYVIASRQQYQAMKDAQAQATQASNNASFEETLEELGYSPK